MCAVENSGSSWRCRTWLWSQNIVRNGKSLPSCLAHPPRTLHIQLQASRALIARCRDGCVRARRPTTSYAGLPMTCVVVLLRTMLALFTQHMSACRSVLSLEHSNISRLIHTMSIILLRRTQRLPFPTKEAPQPMILVDLDPIPFLRVQHRLRQRLFRHRHRLSQACPAESGDSSVAVVISREGRS